MADDRLIERLAQEIDGLRKDVGRLRDWMQKEFADLQVQMMTLVARVTRLEEQNKMRGALSYPWYRALANAIVAAIVAAAISAVSVWACVVR